MLAPWPASPGSGHTCAEMPSSPKSTAAILTTRPRARSSSAFFRKRRTVSGSTAAGGDEVVALNKVKVKYLGEFAQMDLHFFLGTLRQFHGFSPNPWVIIGVFPVPHEKQLALI